MLFDLIDDFLDDISKKIKQGFVGRHSIQIIALMSVFFR